jgi:hypothetical protein
LELCHKVLYPPYWPRVHDRTAVAVVMAVVVVVAVDIVDVAVLDM